MSNTTTTQTTRRLISPLLRVICKVLLLELCFFQFLSFVPSVTSSSSFVPSVTSSSSSSSSSSISSGFEYPDERFAATAVIVDDNVDDGLNLKLKNSCSSMSSCRNCSKTYTCHWCNHDDSCHARGSIHGCAWGARCDAKPKPQPPKENSTCASHLTCSDCALSSHFCHWCEHDNTCHAVGSPYGCAVGVNCYSNDRCRRNTSEPLYPGGPQDILDRLLPEDIPTASLMGIGIVGLIFICCFSCCHFFATNVKGAYDDLATITMAASVAAPMSVIGGPAGQFYTTLEPHPEEAEQEQDQDEEGDRQDDNNNNNNDTRVMEEGVVQESNSTRNDQPATPAAETAATQTTTTTTTQVQDGGAVNDNDGNVQHGRYYLMQDHDQNNHDDHDHDHHRRETRPLLHPSFNGSVEGGFGETRHMKRLYTACSVIYYISVGLVVMMMMTAVYFYPSKPVYNVCNDAVAWKRIIGNIVKLEVDASFEILISLKNANRITAALDVGKGSFKFEGQPIGRYEIPPVEAPASAITDIMLVTHVTPDKYQALRLAEAYYMGKLILEAEFEGTIRVPALWDYTFDVKVGNIRVDVNQLSDRSLCHCPSWNNHSSAVLELPFLGDSYQ